MLSDMNCCRLDLWQTRTGPSGRHPVTALCFSCFALSLHPAHTQDARKRTGLPCNFTVKFYEGKYFPSFGSIFPVEDIVKVIPKEMVSVKHL